MQLTVTESGIIMSRFHSTKVNIAVAEEQYLAPAARRLGMLQLSRRCQTYTLDL